MLGKRTSGPVLRNRRLKWAAVALALCGLLLAVSGSALVCFETFPGVKISRARFDTATYDSPPRTVSGLLLRPLKPAAIPTPAVVFCHGVTLSKEAYLAQCRALARKGIVVLDIDMRGHGETGGANDMGRSERHDIWAAAEYLAHRSDVDPGRIAAAGHSLGATAATTAGIFQRGDRIKAVVAIGCQAGRKQAIGQAFGNVHDFLKRIWPFLAYSRQFSVDDARALADRDVIGHMNNDRPPNFELVIGDRDSVQSVAEAEEVMRKATGRAEIRAGVTYGSFARGNARRLVVTHDTHLSEAYGPEAWTALGGWLFQSFGLPAPGRLSTGALLRYFGQGLLALGFLLIALALLYFLRVYRSERGPLSDPAPYRPARRPAAIWLAVASSILFAAISLVSFPFAKVTGIRAFVPFLGADVLSSLALARTILLVPVVLLLFILMRIKKWGNIPMGVPKPSGLKVLAWSAVLGICPVAIFVILYAPTAHGLFLTRGTPASLSGFFTLAAVLTARLWAEREYFHYFFLPAFSPRDNTIKRVTYILSESAVRGVTFGLAFIPLVSNPFYMVGRPGTFRLPLVPALMVAGFFIFLPAVALALYARRRSYNVLAPCLALAFFTALVFSCFVCVMS